MQSRTHNFPLEIGVGFGTLNLLIAQYQDESLFPPVAGNFELLDGTPFLLLDGTHFLLL